MKFKTLLARKSVSFKSFKDQGYFWKNEVLKDDDKPYTVFTPYSKRWKSIVNEFYLKSYPVETIFNHSYNNFLLYQHYRKWVLNLYISRFPG